MTGLGQSLFKMDFRDYSILRLYKYGNYARINARIQEQ